MALPSRSSFWEALQTRKLAWRCRKLNEYFECVYAGEEDFREWESLRNQVLFPTFNTVGSELPWIEQATSAEERQALLLLYAPTSPLFKLMMLPPNETHISTAPQEFLPPGTFDTWNKMGPKYIPPFYQRRQCAQGFQFSIFEYFLITFANYPVSDVRRIYEENQSLNAWQNATTSNSSFDHILEFCFKLFKFPRSSEPNLTSPPPPNDSVPVAPDCSLYLTLLSQYLNALICINPIRGDSMPPLNTDSPTMARGTPSRPRSVGRRQLVYIDEHFDAALKERAFGEISYNFLVIMFDIWLNQMSTEEFQPFRPPSYLQALSIRLSVHHLFRGSSYLFDDGYVSSSMHAEELQSGPAQALNSFCINVLKQAVRKGAFHMLRHAFSYSFWTTEQYNTLDCLVRTWADLVIPWRVTYASLMTSFKSKRDKTGSKNPQSPSKRRADHAAEQAPPQPLPSWWASLSVRYRSDYSREFLVLAFPLLKPLFHFLARAPMRSVIMVQTAQIACDMLSSQSFRDNIQQTESLLSVHCGDRDPNHWLECQKQIKDVFSVVLEKPSDKITIEKFRQHWDHQNASQTITDNYDLIQYATAAACNVIDAVQSEQDLALEGVSLKLLIDLEKLFGVSVSSFQNQPGSDPTASTTSATPTKTRLPTPFDTPASPVTPLQNRLTGRKASPPMTESGGQSLTKQGKYQIISGQKKSTPIDATFQGDPRYAPITSFEVALLVRVFFQISMWYQSRFGVWLDLRRFARKDLALGLLVSLVLLIFLYRLVY